MEWVGGVAAKSREESIPPGADGVEVADIGR